MPKLSTVLFLGTTILTTTMAAVIPTLAHASTDTNSAQTAFASQEQKLLSDNPTLNKSALELGLRAYAHLRAQGKDSQQMLTVIDYTKPSYEKRLWVIDMSDATVKYNALVAQGKNSGDVYATHFSNDNRSLESSIGVFLTGNTYDGKHGNSLRLIGLDKGFNSNAMKRDVVMHSAWYVSPEFAAQHHRIGRSWGCPALSKTMEPKVVNAIKDGTVILSYYPDQHWENSSAYLQPTMA